jgi:hypothetical protein
MLQMAGRIVGHLEAKRGALTRSRRCQQLTDIAHQGASRLVQPLTEVGTAAGAVDDEVVGFPGEPSGVAGEELVPGFAIAGVVVQGAAAALPFDLDHPIAVGG